MSASEAQGRIVSVDAELILEAALEEEQLATLREAALSCRISRALSIPVNLRLTTVS